MSDVVVVGVQGGTDDVAALEWAGRLAGDGRVVVVTAFDALALEDVVGVTAPAVREEAETHARTIVAAAVRALLEAGVEAKGVAYEARPADALLETVAEEGGTVLVVGAGKRRGPRDYLLGSTAERVVRHARVPVLVAR